jgi:hypothetical protein
MELYSILFSTGLLAATFFLINPVKFKLISTDISWYGVSTYHRVRLFYNDFFFTEPVEVLKDYEEEEEEEEYLELEGLNKDGEIVEFEKYKDDKLEEQVEILFLKCEKDGNFYYKKVEDETIEELFDYELKTLPRQFLQVELEDDKNKTDIHEHISKYYVENNVIFDEVFSKYYMKKWYNSEISSDYKVNIIDKNIQLLSFKNDTYLKLNDSSYEKLTVE